MTATVLARLPAPTPTRPPKTARYYAEARAKAEARLGRPLTDAEKRIDIVTIDRTLDDGKHALWKAIVKEQRRVASALVLGQAARFNVTPEMARVIVRLHLAGQREARKELRQIGVEPRKLYAETPPPVRPILERTQSLLDPLNVKVATAVQDYQTSFAGVISAALAGRLAERVPGPLDVASRLVSTGFTSGLNDVFADNADVITRWQYSAVMDGATCDACAEHDGEEYETLDELYDVLPNFGPNPDCYGDGRCRCRGVPADSNPDARVAPISGDEAAQSLAADFSGFDATLTAEEAATLASYTLIDHVAINAALRGSAVTAGQLPTLSRLDRVIERGLTFAPMRIYRGVGPEVKIPKVGETFIDQGYVSTSVDESVARDVFGAHGGRVLEIRVPAFSSGVYIPSTRTAIEGIHAEAVAREREFLLPRNSRFRVIKKTRGKVVLELLPPE